jgi:hypothetical protein
MPSFPETTWEDNTPRKAVSADGFGLVAYIPRIMGLNGTVCISPLGLDWDTHILTELAKF